ncbi:MAG: hypothetical protein M3352_10635 [Bacteroidota bacterium]|nr:hypothetical protein [Bacteroidota bacterium]
MQNYLLYQATGSLDQINECKYALIKYLSLYNLKTPHTTSIIIYTDRPAMFEAFSSFFEHFEMKPPMATPKFETISNALVEYEGNFLFCDTDTYPVKPLEILFNDLSNGKIYLYEEDAKKEPLLRNLVIGLSNSNKKNLQKIIREGIAQNVIAHDVNFPEIKNAGSFFSDYKNLPEFRKLLYAFFTKNEEESVPNLIKAAHYFDAQQILKDKEEYYTLPFYKKWFRNIKGIGWSIKQYEKKF